VDLQVLQAVIANRYDVLAQYARSLKAIYVKELGRLRRLAPAEARLLQEIEGSLTRNERILRAAERAKLNEALPKSQVLQTMVSMRRELAALWERSAAPRDQLVRQFQDWCRRAETSGIRALVDFSQRLRSYA
jgi:stearoyl-CoA desaturase (delta-9 desaturase)